MRRILVENARRKRSPKHGGGRAREDLDKVQPAWPEPPGDVLALDEALTRLAAVEPQAAELVHLRYFAGQTMSAAADLLGHEDQGEATLANLLQQLVRPDGCAGPFGD